MSKAEQKRYLGIVKVHMKYTTGTSYGLLSDDRKQIADDIRKLESLGRTEKWKAAINTWAAMVLDETEELDWAYYQYATFAAHTV